MRTISINKKETNSNFNIDNLFKILPANILYNKDQRNELIEEKLNYSNNCNITWGVEWESELMYNGEIVNTLNFLDREDFEYAMDLFNSPIGADGNGFLMEFRSNVHYNLIDAVKEIKSLIKQFLNRFPDTKLYPCGVNSFQINIGNAPFSRKLKFILDVGIYSIVRKLNLIRARTNYSDSVIRIKKYMNGEYLWEYRAMPSIAMFTNETIKLFEMIVNKFYNGETFNIKIDDAGIGWILNEELFKIQKQMEEEINEIFFNLMDKWEIELDERIVVNLKYIDEYFSIK